MMSEPPLPRQRKLILSTIFVCCCIGSVLLGVFLDLIGVGSISVIYFLVLAVIVSQVGLIVVALKRKWATTMFLGAVAFLILLPWIPWTPEKRFIQITKNVKPGMTLVEAKHILDGYDTRQSFDNGDGTTSYDFRSPTWVFLEDRTFSVNVANGKVESVELGDIAD